MKTDDQKKIIKDAFYSGLTYLVVIICAILFFFVIYKFQEILSLVKHICSILKPIIWGVVFAYLVNPIEVYFEKILHKFWESRSKTKKKGNTLIRLVSIILSLILVGGVIYLLAYLAVPEIYASITKIINAAPGQMTKYYKILYNMAEDKSWIRDILNKGYTNIMDFITGWVKNDMFSQITVIINGMFGVVGAVSNLFVGCIVAIYVLLSKETFARQFNLVLCAFFSDRMVGKIKEIIRETDRIFGGFISGKILDSLIIGILFFIGATILQLPYAVLVSVIIG
ncbi:MAG: AI-2E family transporter, partial [Eubacterium sp.]|nr:AI-2E family transporter [Eubacterium sp.]